MYEEKELQEFDKWGVDRPTIEKLDVGPDNIREKLVPLQCRNWRMVGPGHLVADSNHGELHQDIDNNYICLGDGPDGLPLLKKIGI